MATYTNAKANVVQEAEGVGRLQELLSHAAQQQRHVHHALRKGKTGRKKRQNEKTFEVAHASRLISGVLPLTKRRDTRQCNHIPMQEHTSQKDEGNKRAAGQ